MSATESDTQESPRTVLDKERREWERYNPARVALRIGSHPASIECSVLDESAGGLGIAVDEQLELQVGTTVTVVFRGATRTACVRRVAAHGNTRLIVGLEWE